VYKSPVPKLNPTWLSLALHSPPRHPTPTLTLSLRHYQIWLRRCALPTTSRHTRRTSSSSANSAPPLHPPPHCTMFIVHLVKSSTPMHHTRHTRTSWSWPVLDPSMTIFVTVASFPMMKTTPLKPMAMVMVAPTRSYGSFNTIFVIICWIYFIASSDNYFFSELL
jgi:hypothetical protein